MDEKLSTRRGNASCPAGPCRVEGRTGVPSPLHLLALLPSSSHHALTAETLGGEWDPLQPLILSPVVASSSGSPTELWAIN